MFMMIETSGSAQDQATKPQSPKEIIHGVLRGLDPESAELTVVQVEEEEEIIIAVVVDEV